MVAGHYATALVAYERERTAPLWLLLFASIFLDLLMITLVLLGVETMAPPEGVKPSLAAMRVDMTFSHDVVPVLLWSVAIAGFAWWWTRRLAIAAWAAALVLLHEVADFVSGYGFTSVKPKVCNGATYSFDASRAANSYVIKVSAATGEITDVQKLK